MIEVSKKSERNDRIKKLKLSAFSIKFPVILAVVCLFIGTVFVFGMRFWGEAVDKSEAISDTAVFESYEIERNIFNGRLFSSITKIEINFIDREKLYIEGSLQTRKWVDNQGVERQITEVVLQGYNCNIQMLDSKPSGNNNNDYGYSESFDNANVGDMDADVTSSKAFIEEVIDDDIPF